MNKDFRVSITIATHHKTKKLMRRLGDRSFYNLIRLWAYTAANKPDGKLLGMTEEDIEIACDWNGQCSKFVLALLELKFITKQDGVYFIHDWEEHNGYAFHAKERSEKARKAANTKWEKHNKKKGLLLQAGPSNATSIGKQCPSPSPSPSPNKIIYTDKLKTFVSSYINYISKTFGTKAPDEANSLFEKSCKTVSDLTRLDGVAEDHVFEVLRWSQKNDFWRDKVLSLSALRNKAKNNLRKFQNIDTAYEKDKGNKTDYSDIEYL